MAEKANGFSAVPVVRQGPPSIVSIKSDGSAVAKKEWGRSIEFILTLVGYCVGLGNVWRFPYLCYQNGGGAFLIPYVITLAIIGIPLYYLEMSIGQFSSLGPMSIWKVAPMFKGVGYAMMIIAAYVVCYYNVVVAWAMFYWFASMTSELPWQYCNNWWNTETCLDDTMNKSLVLINGTINGSQVTTPSEEYYYNNVLRMSSGIEEGGTVVWQLAIMLLVAWVIIFLVLLKGVDSVGKVSYFVSLFPYVLLTVLLAQSATLDGAIDGVKYYMVPQWDKLADPQAWSDAGTQIFYSLGLSMGSLIAMASFSKFHNNSLRDSIMIPIINCCTSIFAGFVVFTMLGYIAKDKGLAIEDVAKDGPGLVFVVYPEGLATLPVAPLWATLFFFMMTILGFSSQFSMAEGICAAIEDEYEGLRKGQKPIILRGLYCLANFLLGLPMVTEGGFYLFKLMDDYCASYQILIVAIFELAAVSWVYGFKNFLEDIKLMLGKKPNYYWISCWVGITPIAVLGMLGFKCYGYAPLAFEEYMYPTWANALAWLVVAFPLVWLVGYMLYWHFSNGGASVCVKSNKPLDDWGPALRENRIGKYSSAREDFDESNDNYEKLKYTNAFSSIDSEFTVNKIQPSPPHTPSKISLVKDDVSSNGKSDVATTSSNGKSDKVFTIENEMRGETSSAGSGGQVNQGFSIGEDVVVLNRKVSNGSRNNKPEEQVFTAL